MPACSSRLCSWALGGLSNVCRRGTIFDLYISAQECSSRVTERISRAPRLLERSWVVDSSDNHEIRSSSFGIVTGKGIWHSSSPVSSSDANVGLVRVCVDKGASYPLTGGSLFLPRHFASSTSYLLAHNPQKVGGRSRHNPEAKPAFKRQGLIAGKKFRSKNSRPPAGGKRFSGPLHSVKYLQSEHTRGNFKIGKRRSEIPNKSARKRTPYVQSARKSERVIGGKDRGKLRLSRKLKAEYRPDDDGERLKRKRKRIKAHPRDLTFKRGLDSDSPEIGLSVPVKEQKAAEDKPLSANAKFRQIEPSRELLRQTEENLLGRRRLVEWRRAGFDPTRTAPLDDIPESKDRRAPIQETVFRQKLTFIAAAKTVSSFPPTQYTEIAFAGRSNVGKSSLINALTRQWGVARTSEKPGLTQTINFFTLGSELCLVDLPGYGFAFAKTHVKEDWEELVKEYVAARPNLKRVCLLVDAKWGLKSRDEELLQLMESSRTRYQIILTKTDVLPPLDLARRATQILQILKDHRCLVQPLMMVSSRTGAGLPHLRASLARVAPGHFRT